MTPFARSLVTVALYLLAYGASLSTLSQSPTFEAGESLAVLLIFGLGFSSVAWLVTRGNRPRKVTVLSPGRELAAIVSYLVVFSVVVLGYGLSWLKDTVPDGRFEDVSVLVFKLLTIVVIPGWLLTRLGHSWRDLGGVWTLHGREVRVLITMGVLLVGLQLTVGRGPADIRSLDEPIWVVAFAAVPAFLWMATEAGLTEEFFFRTLLQTRLAAWMRSEVAAIVLMSVLFGLAHAPGYVLRGAHVAEGMTEAPDLITAVAYSIAVVSPLGILFGVLWARTRNLLLLVLLHGLADLVPNLAPFVRTWLRP